jgi:AraC-like DNA-binding protein
MVLTVDISELSAASALCELPDGFAAIVPSGGVHDCRPEDMEALRTAAAGMLAGETRAAVGCADLEFELARLVLTALDRGRSALPPPSSRMRDRAIANAVDLIRAGGAQDLSVPELCRAVGASERTLRYAFAEHTGLSPQTYMKTVRLARVRAALKTLDSTSRNVGDVAAQWGFWHVGQFARDYRRMFGELPSATLASRWGRTNTT